MSYRKKERSGGSINLRHIHEFRDRYGKVRLYYRAPGQASIPLPGEKGSPEFLEAYLAAAAQSSPKGIGKDKRSIPGSISELIAGYYESHEFKNELAPRTQASRRRTLQKFRAESGTKRVAILQRQNIVTRLALLSPGTARDWLVALRGLMQYAIRMQAIKDDPTAGIKSPKPPSKKKTDPEAEDGHQTWPEEWIAQFEAYWPIGSLPRLAFALALYTAQRLSDIVRMGPGMVKNGVMTLRQKKTGVIVHVPIDPRLAEIIAASVCGIKEYVVYRGKGYTESGLGHAFGRWCDEAGLPQAAVMHGLRKAWCRRAADMGTPEPEMMAVTGHQTSNQLRVYTKAADSERLARRAIARVSGDAV